MGLNLVSKVWTIMKDGSLRTGRHSDLFFKVYPYMFEPDQLIFLTECIRASAGGGGCIVEAGCAYGATTVFLNKFMNSEGRDVPYYAIDTFSGFVEEQANFEITQRMKPERLKLSFRNNKKSWFDRSMAVHGVSRVKSFQADVTQFSFDEIGPIAFCLLDVDLYLPIKNVLPKIFKALSPGGIIVVDDCQPHKYWDGALQAYNEFVEETGLPNEIKYRKFGIVRSRSNQIGTPS